MKQFIIIFAILILGFTPFFALAQFEGEFPLIFAYGLLRYLIVIVLFVALYVFRKQMPDWLKFACGVLCVVILFELLFSNLRFLRLTSETFTFVFADIFLFLLSVFVGWIIFKKFRT